MTFPKIYSLFHFCESVEKFLKFCTENEFGIGIFIENFSHKILERNIYALLIKTKTNGPKKTHQNETDEIN